MRDFPADAVDQPDVRVDRGRLNSALGLGANFEAGERLTFLLQDGDDIVTSAAAESNENKFHRTVPCCLVAIDDNGMSAARDTVEALLLDPRCLRFGHNTLFA